MQLQTHKTPGHGTNLRRARELAKHKQNKAEDAARAKRLAVKAKAADVEFVQQDTGPGSIPTFDVIVRGKTVGVVKEFRDGFALFNDRAEEVGKRSRARDLKPAAAKLYKAAPEQKESRQVRRRREKPWKN